jgi:hypothetical protein
MESRGSTSEEMKKESGHSARGEEWLAACLVWKSIPSNPNTATDSNLLKLFGLVCHITGRNKQSYAKMQLHPKKTMQLHPKETMIVDWKINPS